MREILFRGKRTDNQKWWFGSYLFLHVCERDWTGEKRGYAKDVHFIVDETDLNYAVDPETVGQYTGITDRNGTKIFEGDIVKWKDELHEIVYLPKYTRFAARKPHVVFKIIALELSEVVGNIHDNPELIEWEEENETDIV